MDNIRLELVGYGYLNVIDSVPLSLMFNINDVRNISARNGAWSKTCRIAGDAHNNSVLGPIFDVNYDSPLLTFNAKRKERVRIIVDGFDMFEGVFQIIKIKKNLGNNKISVVYECHIKGDTSDFYRDIDGKLLTDLDLSQFDHTITESIIDVSMANGTYLDGYQYFLAYNPDQNASYKYRDMTPALYSKQIFDKIFSDAGYSYEWDEAFDLNFDKLITPSNNGVYKPFDDSLFQFKAGFGSTSSLYLWNVLPGFPNAVISTTYIEPIVFNDDSNPFENWSDVSGRYDTTTGRYDVTDFTGTINFSLKFQTNVNLKLTANTYRTDVKPSPGAAFKLGILHSVKLLDINGNLVSIPYTNVVWEGETTAWDADSGNGLFDGDFIGGPGGENNYLEVVDYQGDFVFDSDSYIGVVYVMNEISSFFFNTSGSTGGANISSPLFRGFFGGNVSYTGNLYLEILPQSSATGLYSNNIESYVTINSPIYVNKLLPKEIKQSEFIDGFAKMFNLYIKEDKLNNKKLIIKTRDRFYSDGVELNWTNKLNADSVDIELISNLQKKRKIFSYKNDDKDLALSSYNKETNKVFGQLEYIFDNEFIRDIDKVEPVFSPTIIIDSGFGGLNLRTPYIDSRNPTGKIRVLYTGDYLFGYWSLDYTLLNSAKNFYRYAGHLYPDPINPEEDLNFGLSDFYAHTYNQLTNNNLFNRFYSKQMNVFENGYIMTAYFDLDYSDIATLELNERIFVYDSWWNINKVIDFDVVNRDMTKVELISSDIFSETFIPKRVNISSKVGKITGDIQRWNDSTGNVFGNGISGISISGTGNIVQPGSNNVSIVGASNRSQNNNSSIVGENNISSGGSSMVVGSNNILSGDKSVILGGSGNKLEGENSVLIGGSGGNLKGNNIVKIGGRLITGTNFVSAGRDVVLNRFPTGKHQNLISGSRDDVRQFGSHTIDNLVGGTRDEVI
jgi:hypothetical protein